LADYTQYGEYTKGSEVCEKLLNENPHLSFKALKQKLHQNGFDLKEQTIRNYMSRHRVYSQNGLVPQSHNGLGHLVVGFGAEMWESAPAWGWKVSENRNRCRRICRVGVTLFWYQDGTVQLRFKGSRRESDLMGAFSQAFWHVLLGAGNCERGLADFLRALFKDRYRQGRVERTFDVGGPLPRFKIEYYKKSRGLVIGTDGSHPGNLEIVEGTPSWTDKIENSAEKISKAADLFAENIKTHLEVPKAMTKVLERMAVQHFDDASVVSVTQMIECDPGWCVRCLQRRILPFSANSADSWDRICEDCARALIEKMQKTGDRHE
jgi:hypothetical protein